MLNAKPIILWDNLLAYPEGILNASSSALDHPVQYLADWREYLFWKAGSSSSQSIELALDSPHSAKALALYRHNFSSATISKVVLYGSTNGVEWSEIFQHQVVSGAPILKVFNEVSYQYFKLEIAEGTSPAELGLFFLGEYLQFPCWLASGFDPDYQELVLENATSQEGFLLGAVPRYQWRRLSLNFSHLSDSWVRDYFIPFWEAHIPKPFLFAWDYLNHPSEIYLLRLSEPKRAIPYNPIFRSLRLELEGRV